jgi:hypothetical protein
LLIRLWWAERSTGRIDPQGFFLFEAVQIVAIHYPTIKLFRQKILPDRALGKLKHRLKVVAGFAAKRKTYESHSGRDSRGMAVPMVISAS